MKKHLTLFLACLVFAGSLFAQQHLSFKGVPINGTLKSYTDEMVKAGFHYEGTYDGVSLLTGDFAGYNRCMVSVYTLKNLDVVSHIAVIFPEKDTWSVLLSDYNHLKEMLSEKYGSPTDSVEKFTGVAKDSEKNWEIMHDLEEGEYEWYCSFSTELGQIKLTLSKGFINSDTGSVVLIYTDKANSEKVRSAAMDDL